MGKAARRKKDTLAPNVPPVKFSELEYMKLRLLIRDTDAIVAEAQAHASRAVAKRDAYLAELRKTYPIPDVFERMQWNDDSLEFAFSGPDGATDR